MKSQYSLIFAQPDAYNIICYAPIHLDVEESYRGYYSVNETDVMATSDNRAPQILKRREKFKPHNKFRLLPYTCKREEYFV